MGASRFEESNIVLSVVDDIWLDRRNQKFVVVDYKSQANNKRLDPRSYLGMLPPKL